jgi:cytoskeleton protein RodZ
VGVQGSTSIAIGPALRKVRTQRGLTIDEASRDTRIRKEFLEALEGEDFDRLLGDVHVRGCLRTYASYLGLSPERVVEAYVATQPEELATVTPTTEPLEPALGRPRRRDSHRLLVMIAATVLILAAAFGVLSARNAAPPPAQPAREAPDQVALDADRAISVGVLAQQPVDVTVGIDGAPQTTYHLERGEGRGFEAHDRLTIRLSDGAAAEVTVAGRELGAPGAAGQPWQKTYSYGSPTPSP